jgi:hypothetical protein
LILIHASFFIQTTALLLIISLLGVVKKKRVDELHVE